MVCPTGEVYHLSFDDISLYEKAYLLESRVAVRIKYACQGQVLAYRICCEIKLQHVGDFVWYLRHHITILDYI